MNDAERPSLAIVDLGTANVGSVSRMLWVAGARPTCVRIAAEIPERVPIVLPGVGHFAAGVNALDAGGFRGAIHQRHQAGCPILGICLGAQLLCQRSDEGGGAGLGIIPLAVRRFPDRSVHGDPLAVPNVGWRPLCPPDGTLPFPVEHGRMYFTHSYYMEPSGDPSSTPCTAEYGGHVFTTVIASGRAIGVQFHPEKSHRFGLAFLRSWLEWATLCER